MLPGKHGMLPGKHPRNVPRNVPISPPPMQAHEPSGQKGGTTTSCNGRRTPSSQTQRDAGRRLRIHQPRASKSLPIMPIMHLILILSRLPRTKVFCRQHADAAISLQASCRRSTLTGSSFAIRIVQNKIVRYVVGHDARQVEVDQKEKFETI